LKKSLKNLLNQLDLIENKAVYFRDGEDGEVFSSFSSDVLKKLELIKPDAYYVFNNQPFILFFDLTLIKSLEREIEIHKQVWSFDNSPIVFIIKDTDVKVYNALSYSKKEKSLDEIKLSQNDIEDKFSFWNLQSGTTWKWLQDDYYENNKKKDFRKRVNEKLFQNIKDVRQRLVDKSKHGSLTDNEANSLILRLIFIRYLIDREIKIDIDFISGKNTKERRISFSNLIKTPEKLNQLFFKLNANFNGALFKELDIQISNEQSIFLANVFKGEIEEQGSLFDGFYFEIFDFSIIPVEVISGIYESLIDPETRDLDSAVYTPSFLVDYILKDTVDKYLEENNTSECKIFEVAVGSGIFLVQSLRKMIEKEIELNGNSNKKIFSEKIREIAKSNLFGIDINKEALKVTCFSIYIALLDYQDPKDVEKYPFPNLIDENLFEANFFNVNHDFNEIIKSRKTQFILGNPPWKPKKDDDFHTSWLKDNNKIVGNFEISQSFLLRTKDFMQLDTKAALIVTSTMFYNVSKTARIFKNEFLTTFCVHKFFDLSAVRRLVFEEKNSPASIVYYRLAEDNNYLNNVVKHQSIKSNSFLKNFKILVIEKHDKKEILQKYFIENDWMFKVALFGNTLDFNLLKSVFLKGKSLNNSLKKLSKGAGILKGNSDEFPLYSDIVSKKIIDNKDVLRYYSSYKSSKNIDLQDCYLKSGRIEGLYEGYQILFKEQAKEETFLTVSIASNPVVFKKGIFGISSKHKQEIYNIYSYLISNLYEYIIFLTSGSWGTSTRPQIRWKDEYLGFPFVETSEEIKNKLNKLVEEFLLNYVDFYKDFNLGEPIFNKKIFDQINNQINEIYSIKEYEKDLINYVLEVSRYQFQESKQQKFLRKVDSDIEFLKKYAEVYIQEFEKIYDDEFIQVEIYPLNHFIAMNFVFSDKKPKNKIEFPKDKKDEKEVLQSLANNLSISQITDAKNSEHNLFIQKDIKGFEKNSFYIIKPNEFKCWHRAMAWYDVAGFKETIEESELNSLNHNFDGF
jgi:methylase of polypeptide subunit release factors